MLIITINVVSKINNYNKCSNNFNYVYNKCSHIINNGAKCGDSYDYNV